MKTRKIIFAAMLVLMTIGQSVMAQTYQSTGTGTGNWTSLSTWQEHDGENWVSATSFPGQTSTDAVVTIQADHQVYISPGADIQINDLDVEDSGKLIVHPGGKINIADKMELAGSTVAAIVVNSELPTGTIATLDCAGATLNGTLTEGEAADGVSVEVPYTGGNGGNHFGQTVGSTGVTGLTAVLESGTFASGNASLTYTITGTPIAAGDAVFALEIGGRSCALTAAIASAGPGPCPGYETITDVDGNVYNTVLIGDQCWMAENLRVTQYNNENAITTDLSNADWGSTTVGAYAVYPHNEITGLNSDEDVLEAYGALYNWYAVDDSRGLCPEGWSVPSHDEWTQLEQYICNALGNSDCVTKFPSDYTTGGTGGTDEGNALKSCRQVDHPDGGDCATSEHPRWDSHDTHSGFDKFGFSALPGGARNGSGSFENLGTFGYGGSSDEHLTDYAWFRRMSSFGGDVFRHYTSKAYGISLRCVRDSD